MTAEEQMYWTELIEEAQLPNSEPPNIPLNYLDFNQFSFTEWQQSHPDTFRIATQTTQPPPSIDVDTSRGICAVGDRYIDIIVTDWVSIRNGI